MSTLKVDAIRHNSATSDAITTAADGTCTAKLTSVGGGQLSHRNLIINGDYRIAQRATSSTSNGYQTMDRWYGYANNTGTTVTTAQVDVTSGNAYDDGFRKAAKISLSGAGTLASDSQIQLFTKLEAQDIANSGWNYKSASSFITLSFWVKSSTAQAFPVHIRTEDGTSYAYSFTYTVAQANVWQKITKSIPGNSNLTIDDNNGSGLRVYAAMPVQGSSFDGATADTWAVNATATRVPPVPDTWLTAGASTFEITGVQLEVGDTATSFEHRSFDDELRRCQRYFQRLGGGSAYHVIANGFLRETTQTFVQGYFTTRMRASPGAPTMNGSPITTDRYHFDQTISSIDSSQSKYSVDGFHMRVGHNSVGAEHRPVFLCSNSGGSGSFDFSAEL